MALNPKIGNFSPRFFLDKIFTINNAMREINDWYVIFILTESYNEIIILTKSYTHFLKTGASSVSFLKLKLKIHSLSGGRPRVICTKLLFMWCKPITNSCLVV